MDPDEQLCIAILRNAEINPRISIQKLNDYKALCEKYGYDKQLQTLINNKTLLPNTSTTKTLLPNASTTKTLLPNTSTNKILLPIPIVDRKQSHISLISEMAIKLPKLLWDWKVEENEPPIPIKYPVRRQFNLSLIEEWRRTIAELSLIDQNLKTFDVYQLTKLFNLYNLYFFNNSLPKTKLDISNRLTVTAGTCEISRTSGKCEYNITMSRPLFMKLNLENNQATKSGGLVCKSRLNCLQLVLEHEIIHLISGYYYPNRKELNDKIYSGHGLLFKDLVRNYFGQTESTHQIGNIIYDGSDAERILSKEEIKIGTPVSIIDKKGMKKGVIINIYNKNVGIEFIDGDNWKVGIDFLHKVSEQDDDYPLLLNIKNDLLSKLNMYNNIRIGDTVKFYYKKKDNIITGQVSKLNNRSSKLSIVSGQLTYTIVYSRLISVIKANNTIENKSRGKYTIKDFRIGDKVIIEGGPRSSPIYGSIIKLNRVNARLKIDDSEKTYDAPYERLLFQ